MQTLVAFDPTSILTTGITSLSDTLGSVAPAAIAVGASVLALGFGWRLVKKFAK